MLVRLILISEGLIRLSSSFLLRSHVPQPAQPEQFPPHEQLRDLLSLKTFIRASMIIAKTIIPTINEPKFSEMKLSKILTYLVFSFKYGFFLTIKYTSAERRTKATAVSIPKSSPENRSPSW